MPTCLLRPAYLHRVGDYRYGRYELQCNHLLSQHHKTDGHFPAYDYLGQLREKFFAFWVESLRGIGTDRKFE